MNTPFKVGDRIGGDAYVDRIYDSSHGHTVVLRKTGETSISQVKAVMATNGYHFHYEKSDEGEHGKLWFRNVKPPNLGV